MRSTIAIWIAAMTMSIVSYAQPQKVKARDLDGVWQMKIELEEDFIEKEIEDEDDVMARIIMQATGSFVDGILDELDIKFRFLDDNVCKIYVSAFGSDVEEETGEWYINSKGQLIISDTDSFQSDGDEYWMMQDDILIAMEDGEEMGDDDARVYMVKISD